MCRCMHFRSYVTQMCALHALSCADVCTSDPIYADVCTSDPISRRCVHFRSYMMQMCALPILYDADVCTSGPDSCSCVHFSAANGLQLGASVLLADVLLLVPPLRLRHPLLVFGRMLRLLRRSTMPGVLRLCLPLPPLLQEAWKRAGQSIHNLRTLVHRHVAHPGPEVADAVELQHEWWVLRGHLFHCMLQRNGPWLAVDIRNQSDLMVHLLQNML